MHIVQFVKKIHLTKTNKKLKEETLPWNVYVYEKNLSYRDKLLIAISSLMSIAIFPHRT